MRKELLLVFLLSFLTATAVLAQTRSISGTVLSEQGSPLAGATVAVKGSKLSALTDANGKFSLSVPDDAKLLVVSYVGMETLEVSLNRQTAYEVQLMPSASSILSDVVVVGYGTARKTDLTGAIQRINRADLVKDVPTNILQAMQGKLAGVNVTQNDGAPGAGLSIRIRGSNSVLGGTEPLYVIDGVPFNNNSSGTTPQAIGGDEKQTLNALAFIDPNDIESIDILKDASATAIYGSRGANGVVLITTRKGRSGRDRVELNASVGLAEVSKRLDMLSAYDYVKYQNLAYENSNLYEGTNYVIPFPTPEDYLGKNVNWQDAIFRKGMYQNYTANFSGGNEQGNHRIGFSYMDQEGTVINSNYKKFGISLNLNRNLGKRIKLGTSTSVSKTITNGVKTGTDKSDAASAGVIRSATTYPTSISDVEGYDEAGQGYFITNPVIYSRDVLNQVNGVNIFSSNYLEVALMKGLKFRQNVGINYGTTTRDQYYPRTVYEGYSVRGWGLKADNLWNSLISESILNYNTTIHDDHSIGGMVAATYERTDGQWKRAEAKTFPNDLLKNENLAAGEMIMPVINSRYQSTLISFLGRVNYAYKDKYLLNASYRRDGSSKFGRENKWAGFSSFGVAWKLSKENFMSRVRGISDLKLRFSYGQSGNQGIGSYASLSKLAVYNYVFDGALQTGLADDVFAGAANENLKWETTSAYNAGLDLALFKNRLTLSVDVYQKKTEDLLQFITTPASTGFERQLRNSGSVQNRGIEVQLGGDVIKGKNFEWSANFNIAFNRNKILSLGSDVLEQYAGNISTGDAPFIQVAGMPIGALYGYAEDGYYDNEAEVRSDPMYANQSDAIIKRMIGEVKYRNLDNDPTSISVTDRTFIGNVNPDYTFGFTNNFKYGRFDLSVFVNGVQGNDIVNMNTRFNGNLGSFKNISYDMYETAWEAGKDNSEATGPKIMRQFWRNMLFSRRFIEDGSFVRIKNITLGYNVPVSFLKGVTSIRVAFGVNNLYTFTDYSGFDPEMNSYGDNPALFGVDLGGYPNARTYNLSIRCNF